jgi:hypothetical protein
MSIIDNQRVAAVATLQALGYTYSLAEGCSPPSDAQSSAVLLATGEADAMHSIQKSTVSAAAFRANLPTAGFDD